MTSKDLIVTVQSDAIRAAFALVKKAVPKKPAVPSLGSILFSCVDNHLDLTASNHEVSIRCEILGPGDYPDFSILLPPDRLKAVLDGARADHIEFAIGESEVRIVSGHSRFVWPLADPRLFPAPTWIDSSDGYQVLSGELRHLLSRCWFAGDENSTRFSMGGICIQLTADFLRGVATDGRRMSMQTIRACADDPLPSETVDPIVPIRSCKVLYDLLQEDEHADLLFALNERQEIVSLEVHCGLVSFQSRLCEGLFPDPQMVLSRCNPITHIEVKTAELLWLVKQSAIGTNEETRGIQLTVTENKLHARGESADIGMASAEILLDSFEGTPCSAVLDRDFLLQLLEALDAQATLRIGFTPTDKEQIGWNLDFEIAGSGFSHYLCSIGRPQE